MSISCLLFGLVFGVQENKVDEINGTGLGLKGIKGNMVIMIMNKYSLCGAAKLPEVRRAGDFLIHL